MSDDKALSEARALLARAPVFDGHNDLPWAIASDPTARGDVRAYDLTRVHETGDTDIPRLREGLVGAQFWSAFQPTNAPHPARTTLEQIDSIRRIEAAHPRRLSCPRAAPPISPAPGAPARSPPTSWSKAASAWRIPWRRCASGMRRACGC